MKPISEFEQLVLLAVARMGQEAYGMSVSHEIEARTEKSVSLAAVYSGLNRLESEGLVSSWTSEPTAQRGGRAKKYFVLEPAGAKALEQSRSAMDRMWEGLELTHYQRGH
jgi:DNA-binding PadR family transcriptional regulator